VNAEATAPFSPVDVGATRRTRNGVDSGAGDRDGNDGADRTFAIAGSAADADGACCMLTSNESGGALSSGSRGPSRNTGKYGGEVFANQGEPEDGESTICMASLFKLDEFSRKSSAW
jgi:hypothetical protein